MEGEGYFLRREIYNFLRKVEHVRDHFKITACESQISMKFPTRISKAQKSLE